MPEIETNDAGRQWGIAYQTLTDGPFDRVWLTDSQTLRPYTEESARAEMDKYAAKPWSQPHRLVYRDLPEWTEAPPE